MLRQAANFIDERSRFRRRTSRSELGEASIRSVCKELERAYGNPRHGNKINPLDELIYIILSTRTQARTYIASFNRLKREFRSWDSVSRKDIRKLRKILAPNGLGRLKSDFIVSILERLRGAFGRATLAPLKSMTDEEVERFLTELPGVSAKIAKCVMVYSLAREVLPVDAHVHRVASRLGIPAKKRPDTSQDSIERAIPRELRYGFHVNAVAHGRAVCRPGKPACERCCIVRWCSYGRFSVLNHARA